ncbi:MAG: endo-1,4-beta-xylanase [Mycobacteriales bacterium]
MRNPLQGVPRRTIVAASTVVAVLLTVGVAVAIRRAAGRDKEPEVQAAGTTPSGVPGATLSPLPAASSESPAPASPSSTGSASGSAVAASPSLSVSVPLTPSETPSSSPPPTSSPSQPASSPTTAAPTVRPPATGPVITREFFGLHIHDPVKRWPKVAFGSVRLWDSGVTWRQMQPTRTTWNFAALDAQVAQANAAGKDIIMVLGVTPQWAASRPNEAANYGAGAASPPRNLADWTTYVRTLAQRYQGKITKWELWNEPNAVLFWSAKPAASMVPLAKSAYEVLKAADPANIVLSPGIIVRTLNSPLWLDEYLAAGGGRYADVIAAHFYVKTFERPEALRPSMERIRAIMAKRGVADKPLWDTESSMGEANRDLIYSEPLASAYVAQALTLLAGHGIRRAYWYAWDDYTYTGLYLTRSNGKATEAGRVFGLMSSWLVGARPDTCDRIASGTAEGAYACYFSRGDEQFQIVWHPGKTTPYALPSGVRTVRRLNGASEAVSGSSVAIGVVPVLITTAAA